jgi:four helix bundle protein
MMNERQKPDLRSRTKAFALRVIRLYRALPKITEAQVLGKQLLRSGTSVGAQYREAVRARSRAEFISKIETALQELEETIYWIELLADGGIVRAAAKPPARVSGVMAIFVRSAKTAKGSE